MTQPNMFGQTGDDLPLFSGTAVRVTLPAPRADEVAPKQVSMCACSICLDTGEVKTQAKSKKVVLCMCATGQKLREQRKRERDLKLLAGLPDSKALRRVRGNSDAYDDDEKGKDGERLLREATALDAVVQRGNWTLADVLQIILGMQDAVLPLRLIERFGSIHEISKANVATLAGVPGMTERRAASIRAAVELAGFLGEPIDGLDHIKSPTDAARLLSSMRFLEQEEMRVIVLDTKNRVKCIETVYRGSLHTTVIRIAELFAPAVRMKAAAVVIAHNHPSGDATPSPEDVAVTREIVQAGKLLDIDVLDHVVVGNPGHVSLKERGLGF